LWGIKKQFPQLALHNMILANDMRDEYGTMMNNEDIGNDFSSYIHVSSKHVAADAPPGCENWYVLINAPHLKGQNWEQIISRVRKRLLERLHHVLGEDISPCILFERVIDPRDHERNTNTAFGAIYGNSFNNKFSVFMRHANFSKKIRNLYFSGGSVHPGGGVPLSILSSKIVAGLVAKSRLKNQKLHAG
jgi:phytoene dehydrogenase-like protein